ncbi:hypothetical protein TNCV_3758131 [Trichonephila clavipes]|nr:hypothetical protein TNCV_3758131 [Trichonephila clavipes]
MTPNLVTHSPIIHPMQCRDLGVQLHSTCSTAHFAMYNCSLGKFKFELASRHKLRIRHVWNGTATAGSDVVQSGRPIFDDIFQHLWPYIGNNMANDVMVKRLWLIRIDQ